RRTSVLEKAFSAVRAEITENLHKLEKLALEVDDVTLENITEEERRTSVLEKAFSAVRAEITENLHKLEKLALEVDDVTLENITEEGSTSETQSQDVLEPPPPSIPPDVPSRSHSPSEMRIGLKPLICTLSLLEADTAENKLEVVFHVYDSDANGFLDKREIDGIIEQMMNVARYQQWDTIELEQVLRQMMAEIDYDNDGIVSLEEWRRGGLTNIPLLVLLGVDTEMKEDGSHSWRLRHFSKLTYCNACCSLLVGWGGKQGLSCCC
ncbi:EF hand, partial [Oesophagostomum dentatum]